MKAFIIGSDANEHKNLRNSINIWDNRCNLEKILNDLKMSGCQSINIHCSLFNDKNFAHQFLQAFENGSIDDVLNLRCIKLDAIVGVISSNIKAFPKSMIHFYPILHESIPQKSINEESLIFIIQTIPIYYGILQDLAKCEWINSKIISEFYHRNDLIYSAFLMDAVQNLIDKNLINMDGVIQSLENQDISVILQCIHTWHLYLSEDAMDKAINCDVRLLKYKRNLNSKFVEEKIKEDFGNIDHIDDKICPDSIKILALDGIMERYL